eukprot:306255_1
MSAIPLVGAHPTPVKHHECVIHNSADAPMDTRNQCSFLVNAAFDYDIRIENLGPEFSDVQLLTTPVTHNHNMDVLEFDIITPEMLPMTPPGPWRAHW